MAGVPGPMEMLIVMMTFGGGFFSGGVMGLPPGERDPVLVQCPPQDVVLYTEWAARGKGKPGAPGIDGLAADPEIRAFIASLEKSINKTIEMNTREGTEKVLGEHLPPLILLMLDRPGCLYLDVDAKAALELMQNPPGLPPFFGMLPAARATLVINGGDQADEMAKHLEALCDLLPEADQVQDLDRQTFPIPMEGASLTLHRHKDYFILGWGKETIDGAIRGLTGESQGLKDNPRFQEGMKKVLLERPGSVAWLDIKSLIDKAVKGLGPQGLVVAAVVQQLGAQSVESFAMCSGVVDGQLHSRGFLKTGGKTEGILALAAGRALKEEDFEAVPDDADLVFAFTLDLPKILSTTRTLIAQAGEQPKDNFEQILTQLEKELGVQFEEELFKAFGQAWVLYDSPSNGGVFMTAPILSVEVLDYEIAKPTFEKLMNVVKLALPPLNRFGRGVLLKKKTFMDQEIYYMSPVGDDIPFAPAFTLTKTHMLAAPHPQQLKAHLRFLASDQGRFAAKFQEKIPHKSELFAACYTEPALFARYFVSISPMFATVIFSEIQQEMPSFETDGFEFPSARAFLPYIGTGLSTTERTEDGILIDTRHGVPIPGLSAVSGVLPMVPWLLLGVRVDRGLPAQPRAVPAINQHVPKRPVENVPRRAIPHASS